MIYKPYSVVVVPFPFTDLAKTKKRPAFIRQKIFTIDLRLVEKEIGFLPDKDIKAVKKIIHQCLDVA